MMIDRFQVSLSNSRLAPLHIGPEFSAATMSLFSRRIRDDLRRGLDLNSIRSSRFGGGGRD
jgi:hypothetical protein